MKTTNEQPTKERPAPDPNKAEFKLIVYFKDQNKRTFYNYHTAYNAESKRITIDHKVALNKLTRLIHFKYSGKYKTAVCYHIPSGSQLFKYVDGRLIQEANYKFTASGFNTLINIIQ